MFEEDIIRHRKKKPSHTSKSKVKSNHKHSYTPAIFEKIETYSFPNSSDKVFTVRSYGQYCSLCGKIGENLCFFDSKKIEQFKIDNPNAPIIIVEDFFKTKFVPIDANLVDNSTQM